MYGCPAAVMMVPQQRLLRWYPLQQLRSCLSSFGEVPFSIAGRKGGQLQPEREQQKKQGCEVWCMAFED